jgi:hypothetical protein
MTKRWEHQHVVLSRPQHGFISAAAASLGVGIGLPFDPPCSSIYGPPHLLHYDFEHV